MMTAYSRVLSFLLLRSESAHLMEENQTYKYGTRVNFKTFRVVWLGRSQVEGYSKLVTDVYIQTTMHFRQGSNNQQTCGRID